MVKLNELKIGTIIKKKELGEIGNLMDEDPKCIAISYEIYDEKSGLHTNIKLSCKDYDEIQRRIEE